MQQTLIAYKLADQSNTSPESIIYAKPDNDWYSMNPNYVAIGVANFTIQQVSDKELKEVQLNALKDRLERETKSHSQRIEPIVKLIHRLQKIG